MSCQCHDFKDRLLNFNDVLEMINIAFEERNPLSLSRFSHAELLYSTWPENPDLTKWFEKYRKYNGGTELIDEIKAGVLEALEIVDITGILTTGDNDSAGWDTMTQDLFHKLNLTPINVCSVWATHDLLIDPKQQFIKWLNNKEIVLIGRRALEAKKKFEDHGAIVVDCVGIESYSEIDEVQKKLESNKRWKVALLAAGVPATILAPRLATETGKIAIDVGHGLDIFLDGLNKFDHEKIVKQWSSRNK